MQTAIVIALVAVAGVFLIRRLTRESAGHDSAGCGKCGCGDKKDA